ncbi:hypothetical protein KKJ04_25620, partial [Xenorhabdus bovienii]
NKFQAEVGGKLRFGDPGVRLIEAVDGGLNYFDSIPTAFSAQKNQWHVAPYFHLFGSDELSQRSDVIQDRMPDPYVMINHKDA